MAKINVNQSVTSQTSPLKDAESLINQILGKTNNNLSVINKATTTTTNPVNTQNDVNAQDIHKILGGKGTITNSVV